MAQTTGRLFRCISKTGENVLEAKAFFNVGEIYREAVYDIFGDNLKEPHTLLLYANCTFDVMNEYTFIITQFTPSFYVETYDFVHVNAIQSISLN